MINTLTSKWKRDYPLRLQLATSCPTATSYSYGMRLVHPLTYAGEFLDVIQQRHGLANEFIVIAVAPDSAAARVRVVPGDRIIRIGTIRADSPNAGRRLADESRKWNTPYDIVVMRDGKALAVSLKPDRICEINL
jgi:membrane-associated protease RseP (regulator of RpoE activity)